MTLTRHSLLAVAILISAFARAQTQSGNIDPTLAAKIATIPAIDNHAHPLLSPPVYATDRNFDALPVDNMEPYTDPAGMRPDLPALHEAWQALFNFNGQPPLDEAGLKQLDAAREATPPQQGEALRHLHPRPRQHRHRARQPRSHGHRRPAATLPLGPLRRRPPLPPRQLRPRRRHPRPQTVLPTRRQAPRKISRTSQPQNPPTHTRRLLKQLVTPILEQQKSQGAVAEKFEIAYLRSFGFDDVPRTEAARIYATAPPHPAPRPAQYKRLQDFLFRYIAAECGRLNLPVHIHTTSGGGGYFSIAGDNPLLLEPLFNDPRLRHTNFVLLHGGWPFVHEIGALLQKPNVYLDLSQQSLMIPPRTMSTWLREWLELYPEKVLYATDAYPYSPSMGWEEAAWHRQPEHPRPRSASPSPA